MECTCHDCLACELRDMRARTNARRTSARHNAEVRRRREALREEHRRALAAGATPEQLVRGRAA